MPLLGTGEGCLRRSALCVYDRSHASTIDRVDDTRRRDGELAVAVRDEAPGSFQTQTLELCIPLRERRAMFTRFDVRRGIASTPMRRKKAGLSASASPARIL